MGGGRVLKVLLVCNEKFGLKVNVCKLNGEKKDYCVVCDKRKLRRYLYILYILNKIWYNYFYKFKLVR